ncbi:uncharacterized protein MELLADRAFT_124164 [Melampsora larici-populina 98AG31]|uniref:Secreted protein n=1 Tax=Melampsora larici-populina (strain 98AG31 / pathotype 3-4-7) TaxID=747676 RepID=F4RSF8_MELLP|nr:uncharacterized protein MELLADRAFT_124164 [Melampsora larici-populina 98AG31]EGG04700.1 secreted protein [Melampsora larici-populina 98AG31]
MLNLLLFLCIHSLKAQDSEDFNEYLCAAGYSVDSVVNGTSLCITEYRPLPAGSTQYECESRTCHTIGTFKPHTEMSECEPIGSTGKHHSTQECLAYGYNANKKNYLCFTRDNTYACNKVNNGFMNCGHCQ